MTKPSSPRNRRLRWLVGTGVVAIVLSCLVASFPAFLNTARARHWMITRANRALSPGGGFDLKGIRLSWFGPTKLSGFVIRNAQGKVVVSAAHATWDRNLWQILFDRPRYGTLDLDRPRFDIERSADGSVDLYEALKPILTRNPKLDLHVNAKEGQLRFHDVTQIAPVLADRVDLNLNLPASPRPLTWKLRLANVDQGTSSSLQIDGQYDRWHIPSSGMSNLAVSAAGKNWRWCFGDAKLAVAGLFDGNVDLMRNDGLWFVEGQSRLDDVEASGNDLVGDHPKFGRISAKLKASQSAQGWSIPFLDLQSPIVTLKGQEIPQKGIRLEGNADLAALVRELPHFLELREGVVLERGKASIVAETQASGQDEVWNVEAKVFDLQARDQNRAFRLNEPATLSAQIKSQGNSLTIERLAARTSFLHLQGAGDLDRGIKFEGDFDLSGLRSQLQDFVTLNVAKLSGKGTFTGTYQRAEKTFQATLTTDLRDLELAANAALGFKRDQAIFKVTADGTSNRVGLPQDWSTLRLNLTSADLSADLVAKLLAKTRDLQGNLRFSLSGTNTASIGEGKLAASWDGSLLKIDRLELGIDSAAPQSDNESLRLVAQGEFDTKTGSLILKPGDAPEAGRGLYLAEEGLKITGIGRPDQTRATLALGGDLAPLGRFVSNSGRFPFAEQLGPWSARFSYESQGNSSRYAGRIGIQNLAKNRDGSQAAPLVVSMNAAQLAESDQLEISEIGLTSPYLTAQGSGRISGLHDKRALDLRGTLIPDWAALTALASERIEPGARITGKPSAWRLQGSLSESQGGELLNSLEGEIGLALEELDIYGLHARALPLTFRGNHGQVKIDPIDTTLNGGQLHFEPKIEIDQELGTVVTLGKESRLVGAEINDEVSRRFLSYVAPILDRATRARGRVSVDLEEAIFPLRRNAKRGTSVEGEILFQNVEFAPGPFVDALLDLVGRQDRPIVKLNQPVSLTIADRRVYQHGFAFPLGRLTQIELEGWVDFDRNLEVMASVPLTPTMVGNRPLLGNILDGTRIQVPIRGTLQKPEIDREAMNLAMKDLGKTLLERSAVQGAAALLKGLTKPRDPNAPPPLTREQRRNQRQERRDQRRRARGLEP